MKKAIQSDQIIKFLLIFVGIMAVVFAPITLLGGASLIIAFIVLVFRILFHPVTIWLVFGVFLLLILKKLGILRKLGVK